LTSSEQKFEEAQAAERLLTSTGSWQLDYEEPEDKDKNVRYQAQPPRRLMGIVIGDAVYAVIDMGDGRGRIIHPGMQVPDSEWYVVSIDEEKAILRRGGDVFPKEVTVKLQSSSALISSGGGAAGGGGQRNGAGGGMPGKGKGGFGANPGGGDDIN